MLSMKQARIMLSLQTRMNSKVDNGWLTARYPYLRAVVIEATEAIEHQGWKWWKKQERDLKQLQMEIIDIWHFILSELLLKTEGDEEQAATFLLRATETADREEGLRFDEQDYRFEELDLVSKLELLTGVSVSRRIEISLFESIMHDCGLRWDDIFSQYVSKNVLNFFRQDNGYKEGRYRKTWQGREDNEHLVEIMAELDPDDESYQEKLYQSLARRYAS